MRTVAVGGAFAAGIGLTVTVLLVQRPGSAPEPSLSAPEAPAAVVGDTTHVQPPVESARGAEVATALEIVRATAAVYVPRSLEALAEITAGPAVVRILGESRVEARGGTRSPGHRGRS